MINWDPKIISDISSKNNHFNDLSQGKIPALIIPKILNTNDCQKLSSKIFSSKSSSGLGINQKIGESINSYISNKNQYFKNVKKSNFYLKKILAPNDPRDRMLDVISNLFKKNIAFAKEKSASYSEGIVRLHLPSDSIHIHRDKTSFEAPNFSVSKLGSQMSAILYLQKPEFGGELCIFRKFWSNVDERFRIPEFGYSNNVINNVSSLSIIPAQGDLVIINPSYYHMVKRIKGKLQRISLSFFFGEDVKSNLFAWS